MSGSTTISSDDHRVGFAKERLAGLSRLLDALSPEAVAKVLALMEDAYRGQKRVFIMGNGGSAATASHMACDLGKTILPIARRETADRFRIISLTDNVPWMTAISNDHGYDYVFSEQIRNLLQEGDLLIAVTGSGNSPNILEGCKAAKDLGATVVAFLGFDGGQTKELADAYVLVPSEDYGYIEDLHLVLHHLLTAYFIDLLLDH